MGDQKGFSLPETLVALLLFAICVTGLMHYQLAQARSFQMQIQQREAWRAVQQRLDGYQPEGWQTEINAQLFVPGCQLVHAKVTGSLKRQASLTRLQCEE